MCQNLDMIAVYCQPRHCVNSDGTSFLEFVSGDEGQAGRNGALAFTRSEEFNQNLIVSVAISRTQLLPRC